VSWSLKKTSSKRCLEGEARESRVEVELGVSNVDGSFGMGSNSPDCDETLEAEECDVSEGDAEVEGGVYVGDEPRGVSPRFHA